MILRHPTFITFISTLLISFSLTAQSFINLPLDSVSFGLFVVDYQSKTFEQGTILNYPGCLEVDTVQLPLELEVQPAGDFGYTIMTYPCTGDTVFYGSYIWMGQGEIFQPRRFLAADSFGVREDSLPPPQTIQYWRQDGLAVLDTIEIQAADSAWNSIKNLDVVHQFARYPYQVVIYRYPPTLGVFDPAVAKWIVFLYRNPTSPLIRYEGPAFSLSFNNPELEFPVVVDTKPRTYHIAADLLNLLGENAPNEWTFSSTHQSEHTLSFGFDAFVFGPGDTINWSDTASYDVASLDTSDHIWQGFTYLDIYPPTFVDANTGNPSGFVIRTNNSPEQLTIEDTLSFAISGHARSDLRQFYPLALGNKWKWAESYHYIDSVRTEEVIAVNERGDYTEYVIERRSQDYQLYGGLMSQDTLYRYTHVLDRANIYSAPFPDAISVSFSDANPDEEIEFLYRLVDDRPELLLRKGNYFGSTTWRYGVGLMAEFMDPGAVKSLVGYQIDGVTSGDLDPIPLALDDHLLLPASYRLLAYPNPFNPSATIHYTLPLASQVKLTVFNISGQTVQVMVDSKQEAGSYLVHWNGFNQSGNQVSTGIYLVQLQTEKYSGVVKLIYLK
ncbi:MAG: T9SS type A sorting domain-containing protein [Candidatus Marinimicrobia bacterium]|nr:T9SS type A sorting domain-containing protein [Candidatus Neomarinimicrobiota bacterium]